jgi:hypothetical protein
MWARAWSPLSWHYSLCRSINSCIRQDVDGDGSVRIHQICVNVARIVQNSGCVASAQEDVILLHQRCGVRLHLYELTGGNGAEITANSERQERVSHDWTERQANVARSRFGALRWNCNSYCHGALLHSEHVGLYVERRLCEILADGILRGREIDKENHHQCDGHYQ